ncbi:sugar phosphate isomerase/epimerase [Paenibacillus phyllosphaerae]|uniref:Sugar phosphate isomerase/epimerase n=1 Tax=Paenibacillus phyllosphaerae TaxID=274593 RepID=A0A7W5FRN2_9BACL|nr:sugar phosphate isomerase/epimerase [Paenibacillus phyllosphaerae]MBB3114492.1 sugar phosphate isomerase/epimerase [Paenibacillus phyllosphaerae]
MAFGIGLQPWTIRRELEQDYLGAFSRAATIGYQAAEVGLPPEGITPKEVKDHFDRIGLQALSCHTDFGQLTTNLAGLLEYVKEIRAKYVVLSYYRFSSHEEVLEVASALNDVGRKCKEAGVQLLYHNHDWEFTRFEGRYALDLLLEATDPELVQMELDVYWVQKGGEDPVAYLGKLRNRCPLLHMKDMEPGEEQFFAEVGEGILPMGEIVKMASEVGTEWLIVEQDECRRSPFDSIAISYRNLKKLGVIGDE